MKICANHIEIVVIWNNDSSSCPLCVAYGVEAGLRIGQEVLQNNINIFKEMKGITEGGK